MTAGAESGLGRLQKTLQKRKNQRGEGTTPKLRADRKSRGRMLGGRLLHRQDGGDIPDTTPGVGYTPSDPNIVGTASMLAQPVQAATNAVGLGIPSGTTYNKAGAAVFPTNPLETALQGTAGPTNDMAAAFIGPGRMPSRAALMSAHPAPATWGGGPGAIKVKTAFPSLWKALVEMGGDNGGRPHPQLNIAPSSPRFNRFLAAEKELRKFSPAQIETFTSGEHDDIQRLARKAPNAQKVLNDFFDGPLHDRMLYD